MNGNEKSGKLNIFLGIELLI